MADAPADPRASSSGQSAPQAPFAGPPRPAPPGFQPQYGVGPGGWGPAPGSPGFQGYPSGPYGYPPRPSPSTTPGPLRRAWPAATGAASGIVLTSAIVAALASAVSLPGQQPGLGWFLVWLTLIGVVWFAA